MLSLPWSGPWCIVSNQVTTAQSLVQDTDDVPRWLHSSHVAGEVLAIPQMGGKREGSLLEHPLCLESFPVWKSLKMVPGQGNSWSLFPSAESLRVEVSL